FAHLDRVGEALRRNHEKGIELGYRLAETQHRYADAIIGSLNDGVLVIDAFDCVLVANAAAENMLALPSGVAARQTLPESISDESLLQLVRNAQRAPVACRRSVEHPFGNRIYKLALITVSATTTAPGMGAGSPDSKGG